MMVAGTVDMGLFFKENKVLVGSVIICFCDLCYQCHHICVDDSLDVSSGIVIMHVCGRVS